MQKNNVLLGIINLILSALCITGCILYSSNYIGDMTIGSVLEEFVVINNIFYCFGIILISLLLFIFGVNNFINYSKNSRGRTITLAINLLLDLLIVAIIIYLAISNMNALQNIEIVMLLYFVMLIIVTIIGIVSCFIQLFKKEKKAVLVKKDKKEQIVNSAKVQEQKDYTKPEIRFKNLRR